MKEILKETWSELSQKLEGLLQESPELEKKTTDPHTLQQKFELQVNFEGLERLSQNLPSDPIEKIGMVFKKLHPYFQYGLLLEKRESKFNPVALFHEGHLRVASGSFHEMKLSLPPTQHLQVLSTPARIFVNKFKLNWDPEGKCQAYLMRPTSDFAYILFSPVPDLWMQDQMANLMKEMGKIFSE